MASRVRLDGTTVSDSWDYRCSEAAIRQLEQDYGLRCPSISAGDSLHSSSQIDRRSPTTGELRLLARTGGESVQVQLQRSLDQATQTSATLPQLVEQLQRQGIHVRVSHHQTGEIKSISYEFKGIAFSGTHLGKAYTFVGLQKYRGITYDLSKDAEVIKTLIEPPIHSSPKMNCSSGALMPVPTIKENQRNEHAAKDCQK